MIQVINYTSGRDIILGAAEVRRRLWANHSVAKKRSSVTEPPEPKPLWMTEATLFEEHVIAYKVACVLREMKDRGEINEPDTKTPIRLIVMGVLERHPGITVAELKGVNRSRKTVEARHEAMYEVKMQRPDMSFPAVGRWFGNRDHTTVLHAFNKIKAMKEAESA